MFTYSIIRKSSNGSIHLRLINNRRKSEIEIGLSATQDEFSDALSEKPKAQNVRLSLTLKNIGNKVRELQMTIINDGLDVNMDVKKIRAMVMEQLNLSGRSINQDGYLLDPNGFIAFLRKKTESKVAAGTKGLFKQTERKIEKFCNDKNNELKKDPGSLTFDDINVRWLNAFDNWMREDGISTNTRARYMRNIRTIMNHAIDEELTDNYPFRRFKIHLEKTRKRALSVEDLRMLFNYPVEKYQEFFLDMFKLSFLLIGINLMDMYHLKEIKNGRIEYKRAKTHRPYSIKVEPEAMEIIERWRGKDNLLCVADRWSGKTGQKNFTVRLNTELKKIGPHTKQKNRSVKIKPLFTDISSYWARHTWATIAADLDIPDAVISEALGHGGDTNPTTIIYIHRNMKKVDEANRKVIDFVFYGKK